MKTIFLVEVINHKYPKLNDKWAFSDLDAAKNFADEYVESEIKDYIGKTSIRISEVPFDDPDGTTKEITNWEDPSYSPMTENTKVTLTVGQLKKLISESKAGADGIFHAKGLTDRGLVYDKSVDVYDNNDRKGRFYKLPKSKSGIIYSRTGKTSTLTIYNPKTEERGETLSGDYNKISAKIDAFIKKIQ